MGKECHNIGVNTVEIKTTRNSAYPKRIWLQLWQQRLLLEPQPADAEEAVSVADLAVDSEVVLAEAGPAGAVRQEAGDQMIPPNIPYDSA